MIFLALGSNLTSAYGTPRETVAAVIAALPQYGFDIRQTASLYESEPLYGLNQPWYINTVIGVATKFSSAIAIQTLLKLEAEFGRVRFASNTSRTIDIDVIDWHGQIIDTGDLIVPHPRLQERNFVLLPLQELAPDWRHPLLNITIDQLITDLPLTTKIRKLTDA